MLIFRDRQEFKQQQLPWIVLAGVTLLGLGAWFFVVGYRAVEWPTGATPVGLTLGIVGGVLILFEVLLGGRKKIRSWRRILWIPIGRARIWLAGHIWLGLITLPLLILHSGFRLGEALAATLTFLLAAVVVSGIFGLLIQQWVPKRMLNEVPAETIHSQIDRIQAQTRWETRRLIAATCGGLGDEDFGEELGSAPVDQPEPRDADALGARRAATMGPKRILCEIEARAISNSEPLLEFYQSRLSPFLERGQRSDSPLRSPDRSAYLFQELKARVDPAAHPVVAQLEQACELRRQLDRQARMHRWLHGWLLIHVPLSLALVVLMFIHIFFAIRYW